MVGALFQIGVEMARATSNAATSRVSSSRGARRVAVALVLGLAAAVLRPVCVQASDTTTTTPWFRKALVGMEVGPTGAQFGSDPGDVGYASKFHGKEIVNRCVEAGCEYVVIWARDGEYAYYNSKVVPKCPGLGTRDVLRETVDEARIHDLPVIAYCVVQQGGRFLTQHPELAMRDPDGKPISRYCYNSGYLAVMKDLTAEMLAYGIAGFHIDMLDQGFGPPYGCWCHACRQRFEASYHKPMPRGVTWDADWDRMLAFRYRSSQEFERALRDHIHSVSPGATVDFNYHGNPPFSWEVGQRPAQHAGNGDFVTGETGVWGFSALGVGLNAEFYRSATPGLPFQVAMQRGVRMYHDQTTRPLNDLRWELFTLLAHGSFVTIVDKTGYDGWLDPVAYHRIGQAFHEALAKRPSFAGQPVQDVAIYFSGRTRDWFGRDEPSRYFQAFLGAHRAMVLEHLPWGVMLDENVTLEGLRSFPVVLLPGVAILSDQELAILRRYVEDGGSLCITGWTGLLGQRGEAVEHPAIESLVGARFVRRLESRDNHVRFTTASGQPAEAAVLASSLEPNWPFLVEGPAAVYEPTTATPLGELLRPHRTVRQRQGLEGTDWPQSADAPVGPAVLVHKLGKGRVVTFAAAPDVATAGEHPTVEARTLLANAIRALLPHPRLRIDAPAFVEVVVRDEPTARRMHVHFLAYSPTAMTTPAKNRPYVIPGLIEDPPCYRALLRLSQPVRDAKAWSEGTQLQINQGSVGAVIKDIHEVLTVHY
jgi:Hypothetical glycosyl hydrolase 6